MKLRWSVCFLAGFISLAILSANMSAVTGAQWREEDDDDEAALDDPLPSWVDLRVFILRPRVVKPNHLGTCAESVNDNVDHFETARWHLSGPIVWRLNRATVPPSVAGSVNSVLSQSFDTWFGGIFSQGPDTNAKRAKLDKINAILWKNMGRSTLGRTFIWFSRVTGEVVEVDTVFNKRLPWAIFPDSPDCQSSPHAYDLQNIATHEFGHWIGLEDLFGQEHRDLTMFAFSAGGEVKKRSLGTGDISGRDELSP
jgi:hypothetical protein